MQSFDSLCLYLRPVTINRQTKWFIACLSIFVLENTQIAIICWANVGILLAALLQMTLAQHYFGHWPNVCLNGWFDVGLMCGNIYGCLLYTSDAADDMQCVDLGGRRIIKKKIFFKQKTAYEM